MTARYFLCCLALALGVAGCVSAKAKKKTGFTLIEAYNKKVAEGEQGPPMTGDHFVIRWNESTPPETFFWRGQNGWLSCKTEIVHKKSKSAPYVVETDNSGQVRKGDTVMLSPVTGGRFPIPQEIPTSAKNTLFYKTAGSAWLSFPVKKIAKK